MCEGVCILNCACPGLFVDDLLLLLCSDSVSSVLCSEMMFHLCTCVCVLPPGHHVYRSVCLCVSFSFPCFCAPFKNVTFSHDEYPDAFWQLLAYLTVHGDVVVIDTVTLCEVEILPVSEVGLLPDVYTMEGVSGDTGTQSTYLNTFRVCDDSLYLLGAVEMRRIRCACVCVYARVYA